MYTSSIKKEQAEQASTRQQIIDWINQRRPDKCLECLQWLNYCVWWEKNYECGRTQASRVKEIIKHFR